MVKYTLQLCNALLIAILTLMLIMPSSQTSQNWIIISNNKSLLHANSNFSSYVIEQYKCSDTYNECHFSARYNGDLDIKNTVISQSINISVIFNSNEELNIKISDSAGKVFELPQQAPYPHDPTKFKATLSSDKIAYYVQINIDPFNIRIFRRVTDEILFDSSAEQIILSTKYTSFGSYLPTLNIFGLGERFNYFQVKPNDYVIWNRDRGANGTLETGNTYGCHPVYLMQEQSNLFHILMLRSINDMDVNITALTPNDQNYDINLNTQKIKYQMIGGIIDLKLFITNDANPEPAVILYHSYLDRYMLPSFWSLGYMHSRYGFHNYQEVRGIVKGYMDHRIPLDTFFLDIDYMDNYYIWSVDDVLFAPSQLDKIKQDFNKSLVVIIDPSIAAYPFYFDKAKGEYKSLREGFEMDVFLKSKTDKHFPFLGKQWAGPVHYVDFSHPNASKYWNKQFSDFKQLLNYTGIWLDMNEVGQFSTGRYNLSEEAYDSSYNLDLVGKTSQQCVMETELYQAFMPGGTCPSTRTLNTEAEHFDGQFEINIHNAYGYHEVIHTFSALKQIQLTSMPFVLTRSNMFGSGKYATHWSGDNVSNFLHLKLSIASIVRHNFYGMPHIGADICGFQNPTNPELCARWMQLGAMYPFSRNHNAIYNPSQAPFNQGHAATVAARKNLQLRYSMLRHYYSLYMIHNGTGTVFKPLFFEFAEDRDTMNENIINSQFLIGRDLLLAPVLYKGKTTVEAYFPTNNRYYSFLTGEVVINRESNNSRFVHVTNYLDDYIPIYQREMSVIPVQDVADVMNTNELNSELYFKVAFSEKRLQDNQYYMAEGYSILLGSVSDTEKSHQYCRMANCLAKINVKWVLPLFFSIQVTAFDPENVEQMLENDSGTSLAGVYLFGGFSDYLKNVHSMNNSNLLVSCTYGDDDDDDSRAVKSKIQAKITWQGLDDQGQYLFVKFENPIPINHYEINLIISE